MPRGKQTLPDGRGSDGFRCQLETSHPSRDRQGAIYLISYRSRPMFFRGQ